MGRDEWMYVFVCEREGNKCHTARDCSLKPIFYPDMS